MRKVQHRFELQRRGRPCSISSTGCKSFVSSPLSRVQLDDRFTLQSIVHPTIISRYFWQSLETSEMIMPGQFQQFEFSTAITE